MHIYICTYVYIYTCRERDKWVCSSNHERHVPAKRPKCKNSNPSHGFEGFLSLPGVSLEPSWFLFALYRIILAPSCASMVSFLRVIYRLCCIRERDFI